MVELLAPPQREANVGSGSSYLSRPPVGDISAAMAALDFADDSGDAAGILIAAEVMAAVRGGSQLNEFDLLLALAAANSHALVGALIELRVDQLAVAAAAARLDAVGQRQAVDIAGSNYAPIINVARGDVTISGRAQDELTDRATLHILRTLEVAAEHAMDRDATAFRGAITAVVGAHGGKVSWEAALAALDAPCRRLLGSPVHELLGTVAVSADGPYCDPAEPLPWLDTGLRLIESASDPHTGRAVEPFFMAIHPVTLYEWWHFLQDFEWPASPTVQGIIEHCGGSLPQRMWRFPASGMTFADAAAYCFWLWATTGYRYRLPTEAEWNVAASGGDSRAFPWGDAFDPRLALVDHPLTGLETLPPAGPNRLVAMSGSVWEYVSTLWSDLPDDRHDVTIPDLAFALNQKWWWRVDWRVPNGTHWRDDVKLVMKGGSFGLGPDYARIDSRIYTSFFNEGLYGGFRLAASAVRTASGWVPEPSPFVRPNARRFNVVAAQQFGGALDSVGFSGCGSSVGFETPLKPGDSSTFAELVRRKLSSSAWVE